MKGLELSRAYYREVGRPMLEKEFPEYMGRIAAGLVGDGSECFGFDDEISRDHDFGPGFCIWLNTEDYQAVGQNMQEAYQRLPGDFLGFPARNVSSRGDGRVGVMEIHEFYGRYIGKEQPPGSLDRWLSLPEEMLSAVTAGEVFEDPCGAFTEIREKLKAYYPEDVRIKKIAARAAKMAQSGQYNYARCMRRGDTVAAAFAQTEFVKNTISMIYLLNRRFMPYYKWMYRGLEGLPVLQNALPLLKELAETECQKRAWSGLRPRDWNPYVNLRDRKVELIEKICGMVAEELEKQGLAARAGDYLEVYTWEIMNKIKDPGLRNYHVMVG